MKSIQMNSYFCTVSLSITLQYRNWYTKQDNVFIIMEGFPNKIYIQVGVYISNININIIFDLHTD